MAKGRTRRVFGAALAGAMVGTVIAVAQIDERRIQCPSEGSILHNDAGVWPIGSSFQCLGDTLMHCDAIDGHDVGVSVDALIECTPIIEVLRVVPEPSSKLMLGAGIVALGFMARRRGRK